MESLAERLSYKRPGGSKDHHKDHRLSKASIGQPMKMQGNGKLSDISENSDSSSGPSMMMKCVIVQRDGKGYGLTVSGDNPVYVQSVKQDGAAAKAGVSQGDRILKVNGAKVTDLNHVEVVKLIKADTYVALTLLGTPPSVQPGSTSSETATSANQTNPSDFAAAAKQHTFYNEKVETIKKMLQQEASEVERIKEEYARNPGPKILKDLGQAEKLKQDLEKQLWKAESNREKNEVQLAATSSNTDTAEGSTAPTEEQALLIDMDYSEGLDERTTHSESTRQRRSQAFNELPAVHQQPVPDSAPPTVMKFGEESSNMDLVNEFQPNNPFAEKLFIPEGGKSSGQQQNVEIMNFEDDDIVADNDTFQDHGPFNDFEKLRQRPAHLAVFFNYVIASHEPANFLLTISVDSYKQLSSSKDMVKQGDLIYKTYLVPNAPYKVAVDDGIVRSIQSVLSAKNPVEETLRGIFDPAVQVANKEIRNQLSLYRMKREQGLGSLFGDEKLQHAIHVDQQTDIRVVDEIIVPTLAELQQTSASDDIEQTRLNIKQEALQAFLNQYGTKRSKSKTSSRLVSMLRSSKPQPMNKGSRVSGSMDSIIDDNKRASGIGGIFGVKGRKRNDSNAISIQPPPQIQEPILNDAESYSSPSVLNQDFESIGDTNDTLSTEKNSSTDQLDVISRHHALSSTDSTSSLGSDERKYMVQLPNVSEDPEIDIDASEQHWSENVPKTIIKDLDKKEVKRQQVINELIYTEEHHLRDLKILEKLFYEPFANENLLTPEELNQAFPNLRTLLTLHRELNKALQDTKESDGYVVKEIGDILLTRFDGDGGNTFKEECATYCGNQSTVLSLIKEKAKKDQKFNNYVKAAQRHPVCRRLNLIDFVPIEFQRLTKYPLLLENILKNAKKKHDAENDKVRKACERCREILAFVNQAVKEAEDKQKIIEIQQNLDREPLTKLKHPSTVTKEFMHIDLTERPSLLQGPLTFRIGQMDKRKEISLHCILYDDVMVLIQKQEERYSLKCYGTQGDKSSGGSHAPFLTTHNLIVRSVATDKRAFFAMSTSDVGPQMYEFVASSISVKRQWMELITEISKKKESLAPSIHRRKAFVIPGSSRTTDDKESDKRMSKEAPAGKLLGRREDNHRDSMPESSNPEEYVSSSTAPPYRDPNILLSKIESTHQEITKALEKKCRYLAEMSDLDEQELETVLAMSSVDTEPDPGTLIKHSVLCVDKLTGLLNECATPENTFIKERTESQPDQSSSNRLSVEVLETGYQSDIGQNGGPEKWAVPVAHHHQSTSSDTPPSPVEEPSAATNSTSDLPLSESDPTFSEGEMSPTKQRRYNASIDTSEGEQYLDAVESSASENPDELASPTRSRESGSQSAIVSNLSVPEDGASEPSRSRPSSGVDLYAQAGILPINKMMDIVISLQTQLTQLMHVTEESESDRQRLRSENQQLRVELQKIENEEPPDYSDVVQDVSPQSSLMTSSLTNVPQMTSLERDIALFSTSHRTSSFDLSTSTNSVASEYKRTARRSTGF